MSRLKEQESGIRSELNTQQLEQQERQERANSRVDDRELVAAQDRANLFTKYYEARHDTAGNRNGFDDASLTQQEIDTIGYYEARRDLEQMYLDNGMSEADVALMRA